MKCIKSLLIAGLLLIAKSGFAGEWYEPNLPFKEAVVEYQVDGMMQGQKTVYIRDYGREHAEYSERSMKMMGMVQQDKEIVISDKDWVYTYDMVGRTAYKTMNPAKIYKEELEKYSASEQRTIQKNAEKFGMDMVNGLQGDVKKNAATLLGYSCDITEMMGVKLYTIAGTGFPLKMETSMMGVKSSEKAVSIQVKSPPASRFQRPENIRVEYDADADRMMRQEVRQTLRNLLEGKKGSRQSNQSNKMHEGRMEEAMQGLSPEEQQQLKEIMQRFGQ